MAMTAWFRAKYGQKSRDSHEKHAAVVPTEKNEEDDDDPKFEFSREPIRRNSRFYRSMRKKRLASSEQSENFPKSGSEPNPASRAGGSPLNSPTPQETALLPPSPSSPNSLHRHHSSGMLPANGGPRSPRSLPRWEPADGGENERRQKQVVETPPDSNIQYGVGEGDRLSCQTEGVHCPDMESISEHMTTACSIHVASGDAGRNQCSVSETAHPDGIKNRLVSNGESSQMKIETVCHTLKIVKNIGFLYQEYRDTSKQHEIELRRQRDGLTSSVTTASAVSGAGVISPPALQLQLRNNSRSLSLWQSLEAVQESGLLTQLSQTEIIMQEAMFELITSEASYYKSLEVLESHFLHNPLLVKTLNQSDMHFLFSNIEEVVKASERFLMDLENRTEQHIQISDVCDIVYHHAKEHFHVFITYVINQVYQEQTYRRILQGNQAFRETMATLEKQPCVRGLSFNSFLILPFQRITRLKLLVQNILKKGEENSEREENAIKAHQQLEKIVKDCNEGVRKMSRTEELISIEKTLEFKAKSVPVISHSRWLLKKGEVQHLAGPKSTRTMRSRKLYQPVYLFLFNNLLLITKRSSSGEKFQVLDSCTRAMLRTESMEDQGQVLANVFNLKLLENQDGSQVSYMLKTSSMNDKIRWICALTPNRRSRFMSTSSQETDFPQVQCIQSYSSQEPDELSIEMADILKILERTDDGWMMAERLHDGEKGWFPSRVVEEIQNKDVRTQNIREALRIQQAQAAGPATGTRMGTKGFRRTPKVSKLFST
ncbi:ephexin-1 [Lampris incognitus]|uniref:ephexin-1 n=1 Tax=Lampris incognitus TaxID=2546036 RepID=UPI0024B53A5E|nr:ephexin-1 [Lampris incognitus]